ncbi:helix-turn-helix transcriptional regulator [Comamonas sp. Y6]|uniref:Helix-turn-helix transcriptional regulator n=1 Tax=Comamonas resistens TaxID=3046670 RepID=A0ABY8SS78_9BURK|nr:helix-turn-helix transcriptional regulator [Comamonas resistens]MDL5035911.1 helix-turn-helix transcriptional regulator [Comamonas resistens]WHS65315.1 helix-turn-helix transcriptional regulator [Comamonas resistens]
MTHLGERIRARRQELGLSQGRLAQMAEVTASAVSQIESGAIRTLKNDTLARLAVGLQTTALELMADLHVEAATLPSDEQRLLDCYRKLQPPLQDIALKLIKALQ